MKMTAGKVFKVTWSEYWSDGSVLVDTSQIASKYITKGNGWNPEDIELIDLLGIGESVGFMTSPDSSVSLLRLE